MKAAQLTVTGVMIKFQEYAIWSDNKPHQSQPHLQPCEQPCDQPCDIMITDNQLPFTCLSASFAGCDLVCGS